MSAPPPPHYHPPAPYRPTSGSHGAATWVLVFVQTGVAALASLAGLFLVMGGDSCGSGGVECNNDVIMLGALFGMGSPWVVLGVVIAFCIHRLQRRRSAWWLPVLGVPLTVALLFLAYFVTTLGISG